MALSPLIVTISPPGTPDKITLICQDYSLITRLLEDKITLICQDYSLITRLLEDTHKTTVTGGGQGVKRELVESQEQELLRKEKGNCQTPVLGRGLGVDFTFVWDNHNHNNPHLNFMKGTVLGDKEQGVGIRDKGKG